MPSPREVVLAWVDAFNRRDAAAAAALYHEDAVNIQVAAGEPTVGRQAIRDGFAGVALRGCGFFHVVDGRIKFQRGYGDKASWFGQLGLPV